MNLRDYQRNAVDFALRDFKSVQSTLVVMPTGTGKTVVIADIVKKLAPAGSALILAHREELLNQAKRTIETHTGLECEFELADRHASEIFPAPVLLASVQTMTSGRNGARRMHKFSPHSYGLVVVDEAHHTTASTYAAVLDYFKSNEDIKILGVTATPERADEEALGQMFESVAYDYTILQAIKDGWLVPVQQQLIDIQDLDFSHVRTTAGDLNATDLAAVMESERNLYGICDAVIREHVPGDKGIMFTVSVRQAEMAADILNRYRPDFARAVSGKTPAPDRERIMRDFREGRFSELVNCNLVSEGFDVPDANKLHQARPTKSKLLYQQQLGRIMRPLPGSVDNEPDAASRIRCIADSRKPVATVMDFVGNAGKHKLIHAIDVLGGRITDSVRELAERELRTSGRPTKIDEMIIEAEQKEAEAKRKQEAARKARITAHATYTKSAPIDPFNAFDVYSPPYRAWDEGKSLSEKQRNVLRKQGIDPDTLTFSQGRAILNEQFRRWKLGLCTLKQANLLKKHGYETRNTTMKQASELISALASNGWRRTDV